MLEILDNSERQSIIRNLDNHKLEVLSQEIRKFLIDNISKTGGHLKLQI